MLADRLFRHHENFMTATSAPCEYTHLVDSLRSHVERKVHSLRIFGFLSSTYRGTSTQSHLFHEKVVYLICQIINTY